MPKSWFAVAGIAAFVFFWSIAGQPHLCLHDHWCAGHIMLLADCYLHADFATPLGMPMEDAFGPVGTWAPYTGWPPLYVIVLAGLLKVTGSSLGVARAVACLLSAVSAVLVMWLTWRVTQRRLAALLGLIIFAGHVSITTYCSFVCYDTAALTWSLLLICLYPSLVCRGSRWRLVCYCLLAGVGGLLSWQCYLAPVACGLALAVTDWNTFRLQWRRVLAPCLVLLVVGALLLCAYRYVEENYETNAYAVGDSFLARTGIDNPQQALRLVCLFLIHSMEAAGPTLMGLFLVLAASSFLPRQVPRVVPANTAHVGTLRTDRLYVHALWMFPVCWLFLMPNMHLHHYQAIYAVPFLAVACARLIRDSFPDLPGQFQRIACSTAILACFLGIAACDARLTSHNRVDIDCYQQLEADIQELTSPTTVVVMDDKDRGIHWRVRRPVISLARLHRVANLEHVLVVQHIDPKWQDKYTIIKHSEGLDYSKPKPVVILRPKQS